MQCDEVRQEADLYAVGALDADQREAFERHAETCADCRELLETATHQTARLGFTAPLHRAPKELHARLRREIESEEKNGRRPFTPIRFTRPAGDPRTTPQDRTPVGSVPNRRHRRWATAIAACAALVATIAASVWIANLQMQTHTLAARSQSLQRRVAELESQRDAVMLLVSDGTERLAMQSTDTTSHAAGAVIWNASQHKCSVFAAGLPAPPPDQAYHVWLMGGNHSWDEGELTASPGGAAEKTIDLTRYTPEVDYQLVVSRQPRQAGSGEWQPLLRAWVGN